MRRTPMFRLAATLATALAVAPALAGQGVLVAPHTIIIDHRSRSSSISVYNPGTESVEISLSTFFGYPVTDSLGQFDLRTVETPDSTMPSAAGWIQAFPRVMTLGPKETQTVRLLGRPPATLPDGEYWARLMVSARGASPAAQPVTDTSGVQVGLKLEVRTVLPMLYRKGAVRTGVRVDSLRLVRAPGDSLELRAHLTRTGNSAFLGMMRAAVVDSAGRSVASTQTAVAVYFDMSPRVRMAAPAAPAGRYRLRFELASERDDLPSSSLLQVAPIRDSVEAVLP